MITGHEKVLLCQKSFKVPKILRKAFMNNLSLGRTDFHRHGTALITNREWNCRDNYIRVIDVTTITSYREFILLSKSFHKHQRVLV